MSRPLRIEYPNAVYHVTSRGNRRSNIFSDNDDKKTFIEILEKVRARHNWLCHAYCLMGNHYHLLLETPDANLSKGMRQLNGVYTQKFNVKHKKPGHLFQGRYKAIVVEKERYLLELCRYIVLNPVRAKMVKSAEQYKWSSYRAACGIDKAPAFLFTDWTLSLFSEKRGTAEKKYAAFVREGVKMSSPFEETRGQIVLGSGDFLKMIEPLFKEKAALRDVPRRQKFAARPGLEECLKSKDKSERNEKIKEAYFRYGYTSAEIGDYMGLHYSSISKIANAES